MSTMKYAWLAILMLVPGAWLIGCQATDPIVDELPPPYFSQREPRPMPSPLPPPAPSARSIAGVRIVVDAGHGGKDPGAPGRWGGSPEKTIVLAVANDVARRLSDLGVRVTQTRNSDRFIELDDRAASADRVRADLFISIHADSAGNASASGATFYIANNASIQSQRAALRLNSAFRRAGLETRGVRRAGYRVLVGHSRPAVLIECGFLSNRGDSTRLNNAAHRARLAQAIVDGLTEHLGR